MLSQRARIKNEPMMGLQLQVHACFTRILSPQTQHLHSSFSFCNSVTVNKETRVLRSSRERNLRSKKFHISSSSNVSAPLWENWAPEKSSKAPSLSDVLWPSAGAFAAMALLGKVDQILAPRGISMTIAPLGAVCAVLFATPASPGARKYNMFVAQIGCAAIGVLAFSILGPGWLARSTALSAAMAFMLITRSVHPPAASLPLLFIDGVKLHNLNFWYTLFPGAAACVLLCLIVCFILFKRFIFFCSYFAFSVHAVYFAMFDAARDGMLLEEELEVLSEFAHSKGCLYSRKMEETIVFLKKKRFVPSIKLAEKIP